MSVLYVMNFESCDKHEKCAFAFYIRGVSTVSLALQQEVKRIKWKEQ